MNFDDWFNQIESYCLKSERFFAMVDQAHLSPSARQSLVKWMEAAYEAGREAGKKAEMNKDV